MIWAPFVMAVVLGGLISAGLYLGYRWPSPEPEAEPEPDREPDAT